MSFWSHLAAVAALSLAACQSVRTQTPTLDQPVNLSINAPESALPTPTPPPPTPAPVQYSYSSVPGVGRVIAMTFDDGPSEKLTPMLLDILKQRNIHATFFVVGQNAAEYPDILKRAVAEGHEIGNHSWNHPQLTALSADGVKSQIEKTNAAIRAAIGHNPVVMRPPYGATSVRLDKLFAETYGMKVILWSVDPLDWKYRNSERVKRQILAQVTPGAIVLSHDIHATTVAAMPDTLDALKAAGYKFVTVSELLAMKKEAASVTPSPTPSAVITPPATPSPTPATTVTPYKVDRYDSTPTSDGSATQ
ncbi:MAG: polysaccharide deacetylase family protein [Chthoniobacterales bacterium]